VNLPLGLRANVWGGVSSGRPYTITTGFDDNNDTVFNDRPEGVGRNSARGTWQRDVNLRLGWQPFGASSGRGAAGAGAARVARRAAAPDVA
jgi:hypothetical protein